MTPNEFEDGNPFTDAGSKKEEHLPKQNKNERLK